MIIPRRFLFFSLFFILFNQPAIAKDQISHFQTVITINQDTSITTSETIYYQTDVPKHGLYRYLPLEYRRQNFKYQTVIDQIQVTDEASDPIPFTRSRDGHFLVLKIGDANVTFTGEKTYLINYRTTDALTHFADHDELYWDVTGEGWRIPVVTSQATINSSFAPIQNLVCYSGPVDTNDGLCQTTFYPDQAKVSYQKPINYQQNLTFAISLSQPNQLHFPSTSEKFIKALKANWPFIFLPLPLLITFFYWYKKGRDYLFLSPNIFDLEPNRPVKLKPLFEPDRTPLAYEPIAALTPGEAGALIDEKIDTRDIVAEIIDLARKKYLKIEPVTQKGLLFSSKDYLFTRLKPSDTSLPEHQRYLLDSLLQGAPANHLSKLKGSFMSNMTTIRDLINRRLIDRQLYTNHPNTARALGFGLVFLTHGLVFVCLLPIISFLTVAWPLILLGGSFIISSFFAWNLVQKTALGSNLALQAKGLRQTIRYGRWREQIKEKHLFIEEVLPFAVSLGVINQLAADMKDLDLQAPEYFSSPSLTQMSFGNFVSDFSTQTSSSLSYNPSSSSWSGGSGFSGGSSGGGGGGGGGGSW